MDKIIRWVEYWIAGFIGAEVVIGTRAFSEWRMAPEFLSYAGFIVILVGLRHALIKCK